MSSFSFPSYLFFRTRTSERTDYTIFHVFYFHELWAPIRYPYISYQRILPLQQGFDKNNEHNHRHSPRNWYSLILQWQISRLQLITCHVLTMIGNGRTILIQCSPWRSKLPGVGHGYNPRQTHHRNIEKEWFSSGLLHSPPFPPSWLTSPRMPKMAKVTYTEVTRRLPGHLQGKAVQENGQHRAESSGAIIYITSCVFSFRKFQLFPIVVKNQRATMDSPDSILAHPNSKIFSTLQAMTRPTHRLPNHVATRLIVSYPTLAAHATVCLSRSFFLFGRALDLLTNGPLPFSSFSSSMCSQFDYPPHKWN